MHWTKEIWAQVDALLAEGKSRRQIAEHLGVTHQSLRVALCLRPVSASHQEPIDEAGKQLIREHYGRGWTAAEIARIVGCTPPSVIHCAHEMGLLAAPKQRRRSKKVNRQAAKLPPKAAEKRPSAAPKSSRNADALPAGHPLTWETLQSFLSPENRRSWPGLEESLPKGTPHKREPLQ